MFIWKRYHLGPYRIEVYLTHQFQQVGISINQNCLKPSLKEMTDTLVFPIEPRRIPQHEILHEPGKRNVRDLKEKVDMIGHEAEGMNAIREPRSSLMKKLVKAVPVYVIKKQQITCVAANNDMIETARDVFTRFTWHVVIVP